MDIITKCIYWQLITKCAGYIKNDGGIATDKMGKQTWTAHSVLLFEIFN
jgi:hypothetical protein